MCLLQIKKISLISFGLILGISTSVYAATVLFPSGGGTGTSTAPTLGKILLGQANGTKNRG